MTTDRLTFKEMCAEFDVTPRTLRYYEYIELLQPDREGRARFYGARERARMKLILQGRKFGFPLETIRQWLLIRDKEGNVSQMKAWMTLADDQLAELAEQRAQLDEAIKELEALRVQTAAFLKTAVESTALSPLRLPPDLLCRARHLGATGAVIVPNPPLGAECLSARSRARPCTVRQGKPLCPPQTAHSFGKTKVYVICTYVNHQSDVTSLLRKPVVLL
jgi:DNA-binding transcriptional MerR regulator